MSREQILIKTSWISTIGNAILSASKIIIGLFAGSLAVVGDGIDSATDVVISIVMIFTARLINRPPSLSVNSYWLHTSTNRERRSTAPC